MNFPGQCYIAHKTEISPISPLENNVKCKSRTYLRKCNSSIVNTRQITNEGAFVTSSSNAAAPFAVAQYLETFPLMRSADLPKRKPDGKKEITIPQKKRRTIVIPAANSTSNSGCRNEVLRKGVS